MVLLLPLPLRLLVFNFGIESGGGVMASLCLGKTFKLELELLD